MMGDNNWRNDWKGKRCTEIHQLRIIGIHGADFNTALNILFAENLLTQAEKTASMTISGVHNRTVPLPTPPYKKIMLKYGRYMKATIAVFLSYQTASVDCMHPGVTNIISQVHGIDSAPRLCHIKTIDESQSHIWTALGVSSGSYKKNHCIGSLA